MTILKILHIPDSRLKIKTTPVTIFDDTLQKLIEDMFETMYAAPGVGLAATQIGLNKQIAVIDVSPTKDQQYVLINPEIVDSRDFIEMEEGCLSVPGTSAKLPRASWVKLQALDRFGKLFELEADGLLAECIQHEIDHLHGKLYIDYLSRLRQSLIRDKVKKYIRRERKA